MTASNPRSELEERIAALIDRLADGERDDAARDALLAELLEYQAAHVQPYRHLLESDSALAPRPHPSPADQGPVDRFPALPTDVFRHARVASHAQSADVACFHTSGTTHAQPGQHPFRSLRLYDRAAQAAARTYLFPDRPRMPLAILAPAPDAAPHSSLSYMLGRFGAWFAEGPVLWCWRNGQPDIDAWWKALASATHAQTPIALLGTSLALAAVEDAWASNGPSRRVRLPAGSRLMQTGGFKGRARELEPAAFRRQLSDRYGVPERYVVAEYGMTELSSQLYETSIARPDQRRRLEGPGWIRVTPVHPETRSPVNVGEVGILRIDDLANLDSVAAVQTSDLARRLPHGIELLGRAPGASPRGCSLSVEATRDA